MKKVIDYLTFNPNGLLLRKCVTDFLIVSVIAYLLSSFVMLSFNPIEWSWSSRLVCGGIIAFSIIFALKTYFGVKQQLKSK